jgi:branched-chain amino acid transport system permease protein
MSTFIQLFFSGLTSGSVYSLVALGFALIYSSTRVFNFAQGEFVMIGAVFSAFFLTKLQLPYAASIVLIVLISLAVGIAIKKVAIDPLKKRQVSLLTMVIATLACAILIENIAKKFFGTSQEYVPPIVKNVPFRIGGVVFMPQNVAVIIFTATVLIIFWLFMEKTMTGLAIRAVGVNSETANLMGIQISLMITITFVISASLGGLAGILIGPIKSAYTYMGIPIAVKGFISAILGGMGYVYAAIAGGILLGVIEALVGGYISTALAEIITFALLPVVLMFRPQGLFAEYEG